MKFPKQKIRRVGTRKGFSFLEVIMSVFVLSIGLLGVMALTTTSLRTSMSNRDAIIAAMLAQEGVELVYNIRDTNVFQGEDAFTGKEDDNDADDIGTDTAGETTSGIISYDDAELTTDTTKLYVDWYGFYKHNASGSNTKFARKIVIKTPTTTATREVISFVTWTGDGEVDYTDTTDCTTSNKCAYVKTTLQQ